MFPLTVGDLKKLISEKNVSDDIIISYERIEDVYFEKHGWISEKLKDTYGMDDEFFDASVAWVENGKLRISAHY